MYFNNNDIIEKDDLKKVEYREKELNKSLGIVLIYLLVTLIANVVLIIILKGNPSLDTSVTEFFVSTGLNLVVAISLIFLLKKSLKNDFKQFKHNSLKSLVQIIIGMGAIFFTLFLVQIMMQLISGEPIDSDNEEYISKLFTKDFFRLTILFLDLVILAPIVEELVFRKAIFGFFAKNKTKIFPILVSGFIFGIMHIMINPSEYLQAIPYIAMGLVLSFMYYRSDENIYVNIGIHMLNNLISYVSYVLLIYGIINK